MTLNFNIHIVVKVVLFIMIKLKIFIKSLAKNSLINKRDKFNAELTVLLNILKGTSNGKPELVLLEWIPP